MPDGGVAVLGAFHRFAEHASQIMVGIQTAVVDQSGSRPPSVTMIMNLARFKSQLSHLLAV